MEKKVQELISFEEKVANLFKAGKIRVPIHLSGSIDGTYETYLVRLFQDIKKTDYVFCTWRNHLHYILKGGDKKALLDEILGKETGICGGKAGSMHTIDHKLRFYSSAIVGGICSIAVGVALGIKENKDNHHVYCFIGDGGVDSGHFWEAYRYAIGYNLPINFIIEDNNRSVCTSMQSRWGVSNSILEDMQFYGPKIDYIAFEAKYPHAGVGEFIPL